MTTATPYLTLGDAAPLIVCLLLGLLAVALGSTILAMMGDSKK